jgi:hypothetical protein
MKLKKNNSSKVKISKISKNFKILMRVQAPLTIFLCILSAYTGILSDYKIYTNINNIYSDAIHVNICMYACMLNLTVIYFFSLCTTMTFHS